MLNCVRKVYDKNNKGVITHYILSDGYTEQCFEASEVKQNIMSGNLVVDNLKVTTDGRLIDNKAQSSELEDYYNSCRILGIEPLTIEQIDGQYIVTQIPNVSCINIPSFVNGFNVYHARNINLPAIAEAPKRPIVVNTDNINLQLSDINKQLERIRYDMGIGFENLTDRVQRISDYCLSEEHQKEFKIIYDTVAELGGNGWREFGADRNVRFPRLWSDLGSKFHFTNKGKYKDEEAFDEVARGRNTPDGSLILLDPFEEMSKDLYKHLAAVNDIRGYMEQGYADNLNSEHGNAIDRAHAGFFSGVATAAIACGSKAFAPLATATAGIATAIGIGDKVLSKDKRSEFLTFKRKHDVYGSKDGYVKVNRKLIKDNMEEFNAYASDVRIFVIDIMAMTQGRGVFDKNNVDSKYRYLPYYNIVRGTLARCPVDDERLFNYICQTYGRLYYNDDEYRSGLFGTNYNHTENGIQTVKIYLDCLINAFFAAKKYMGYQGLDFLYDCTKSLTKEEKHIYARFMYLVKYGLLLQGLDEEFADDMCIDYLLIDLNIGERKTIFKEMRVLDCSGYYEDLYGVTQ